MVDASVVLFAPAKTPRPILERLNAAMVKVVSSSVAAREKGTGVEASIVVKPSYGLTNDEVARMLQEGFSHASEDRDARALAEQRVEAAALAEAITAALAKDADLLSGPEREALDVARIALRMQATGTDHRAIKKAIEHLNAVSGDFAARRMDRAVSSALAGRRIDQVET